MDETQFDDQLFTSVDDYNDRIECIICKNDNSYPQQRLTCVCKCFVHKQCTYRWLNRKRQCPHCNESLLHFEDWVTVFYSEDARDDFDEDELLLSDNEMSDIDDELHHTIGSGSNEHGVMRTTFPLQHVALTNYILRYIEANKDSLRQLFFPVKDENCEHEVEPDSRNVEGNN